MKVVFLDIDGVLNCSRTKNPRKFPYVVDKRLLARLLRVINGCQANIVLTSSWRIDPIGRYAAKYWGIPCYDVCPDLPNRSRREEILLWLRRNPKVTRFAVLDDEDDDLDGFPLFQPSAETGLTREIANGLKRFLEGKSDSDMRASGARRAIQKVKALFEGDKD